MYLYAPASSALSQVIDPSTSRVSGVGGFCMLLSDVIEAYLHHFQHERGLSKKTCEGYQAWLHNLHDWMQTRNPTSATTPCRS